MSAQFDPDLLREATQRYLEEQRQQQRSELPLLDETGDDETLAGIGVPWFLR